jgi:hypothetical protein
MKQIDLSSVTEWVSEQLILETPPEERYPVQPTIDMVNKVTQAHNALADAVMDYCKFIGYKGCPIRHDPIEREGS